VQLQDLRLPAEQPPTGVSCPCLWVEEPWGVRAVPIPKYNNENRWYVEKYQNILRVFSE